ncbi:uncharacterized protein LOC132757604 [Ruditapes philippinarum]|uniref:uncharacterized protein LOC132757604 n=1 Tax=Ruditapes philippinarum TaxID=129788 RepID=UPI00295B0E62|nr:uncharacterized protein LOC132757604 [Ruditapes philippinarum]
MSFWGGHVQIPWIGNVDEHCPYLAVSQYYLSLSEQHISIDEIGDQVQRVDACIHNETDPCLMNVTVEMRTCEGFLFYRFPYIESLDKEYVSYTYICPDTIYYAGCDDFSLVYTAGTVVGDLLVLSEGDVQHGWLDAYIKGQQFVYPTLTEMSDIIDGCIDDKTYQWGFYLPGPIKINEVPTKLPLCYVSDYDDDGEFDLQPICGVYNIYARTCNDKIQFDVSLYKTSDRPRCLILQKSNGMSTAALVGIIIGSVIGCAVLAVIVRVVTVIVRRNCHKGV